MKACILEGDRVALDAEDAEEEVVEVIQFSFHDSMKTPIIRLRNI